jgi:hypothetical protein
MTPTLTQRGKYLHPSHGELLGLGHAIAGVAARTHFLHLFPPLQGVASVSALYLLVVVGTALRFGSRLRFLYWRIIVWTRSPEVASAP